MDFGLVTFGMRKGPAGGIEVTKRGRTHATALRHPRQGLFNHSLGLAVGAVGLGWSLFVDRHDGLVAVDRAGRREDETFHPRRNQRVEKPQTRSHVVGEEDLGKLHRLRRLDAGREMDAGIKTSEGLHEYFVTAVALDEGRPGRHVVGPASHQVVERHDFVALGEQEFGGVRSNEAGRPGNENSHTDSAALSARKIANDSRTSSDSLVTGRFAPVNGCPILTMTTLRSHMGRVYKGASNESLAAYSRPVYRKCFDGDYPRTAPQGRRTARFRIARRELHTQDPAESSCAQVNVMAGGAPFGSSMRSTN